MFSGEVGQVLSVSRSIQLVCRIALGICCLLVIGCDSRFDDRSSTFSSEATMSPTNLSLPVPERIRAVSALDPASISAQATVNGVIVPMALAANGTYSGSLQVAAQTTFPVVIEFSEQFSGQKLILATNTQQVSVDSDSTTLNLRRADYDFDSHDDDGDSVSNIVEREQDSDPLDAGQTPDLITINIVASQPIALFNSGFNNYTIEATVGAETRVLSAAGAVFRGAFQVPQTASLNVAVEVIESVTGQRLEVASQSRAVNNPFDQQEIVFESGNYNTPDRDGDGLTDLAELAAGTDITINNNTPVTDLPFTINFSVPSPIQNPQTVYAELEYEGQTPGLIRNANNYTVNLTGRSGTTGQLEVEILDVFNNQPYVLASLQQSVQLTSAGQVINLSESDFNLQIDTDGDGVANYLERQQGSDPFNASIAAVSCNVTTPPQSSGLAGSQQTLNNISANVSCNNAPFELASSQSGFSWNSAADSITWLIPSAATAGTVVELPVQVRNPANPAEVYATLQVRAEVLAAECTPTTTELSFTSTRDAFRNDQRVAGLGPLRLRSNDRDVLIGFNVGAQSGQLVSAILRLTVTDDAGNGNVTVYQDDSLIWSESDDLIPLPLLTSSVGALNTQWDENVTYSIGLTSLFLSGDDVSLILQLESGGNDVAFSSRESNNPPELVLGFSNCI